MTTNGNGIVYLPDASQKRVVSIVDDDVSVREATAKFLRLHGYEVHGFASAEEFLSSAVIAQTGCLVSDVRMPGMSGLELQERLVSLGHRIPIIFVTAFPEDGTGERASEGGAAGFLGKPFDGSVLTSLIEKAFRAAE